VPERAASPEVDPAREAELADSVGLAMLVVLDALTPSERLAFVLHDMFSVPFEEIAGILGRSVDATKQLASRGRRRVTGTDPETTLDTDGQRRRDVVRAFLAASRDGDFEALVAMLHPDAQLRPDATALGMGAVALTGADAVAHRFNGAARSLRPALVDGVPAAVWATGGTSKVVFWFTITCGLVTAIDMTADPARLASYDIEFLRLHG